MDCRWVTGDTDRQERVHTLTDFRENKFKFLATTNMYSRGIDIPEVFLVVQIGISRRGKDGILPNVIEYQHRAGRAGRFGRAGVCISVLTDEEVPLIAAIERELNIQIRPLSMEDFRDVPDDVPSPSPDAAAAPAPSPAPEAQAS
jgi:ATP-dependent RNA helicase DDX19/DBP5